MLRMSALLTFRETINRCSRLASVGQPAALHEHLGDLDGIGGRPLPEVVGHHPEVEAVGVGNVAADATGVHRVLSRALDLKSEQAAIAASERELQTIDGG